VSSRKWAGKINKEELEERKRREENMKNKKEERLLTMR